MVILSRHTGRAIRLLNLCYMVLKCLPLRGLRYLEGSRLELLQHLSGSITLSKYCCCPQHCGLRSHRTAGHHAKDENKLQVRYMWLTKRTARNSKDTHHHGG